MVQKIFRYLSLFAKGLAMGAADVVPGVSGGTIAFISGIYEELLDSIKGIHPLKLKILFKEGIVAFWKAINGGFLLSVFGGILVSVASLAKVISWLLKNEPVLLWAFFFGLIIASIIFIFRQVKKWSILKALAIIPSAALAYWITVASPAASSCEPGVVTAGCLLFLLLAGMIAICAMILPGISGSFILLLLGAYPLALGSISGLIDATRAGDWSLLGLHFANLSVFIVGCLIGLGGFARILSWLFKKAHDLTVAVLTGFMIGSLNKIWPWKETTEFRIDSHGEKVPFLQENILPGKYTELYQEPNKLLWAILLAILGFGIVIVLERLGSKKPAK